MAKSTPCLKLGCPCCGDRAQIAEIKRQIKRAEQTIRWGKAKATRLQKENKSDPIFDNWWQNGQEWNQELANLQGKLKALTQPVVK